MGGASTRYRFFRNRFRRTPRHLHTRVGGPRRTGLQVKVSLTEVVVHLEGTEIARHARSYVPADVVLAPAHARALRLVRKARSRPVSGDVELPEVDLTRYDALAGVGS